MGTYMGYWDPGPSGSIDITYSHLCNSSHFPRTWNIHLSTSPCGRSWECQRRLGLHSLCGPLGCRSGIPDSEGMRIHDCPLTFLRLLRFKLELIGVAIIRYSI